VIRPLLALVGIFRNEAQSIGAVLDSVKGIVDHATLLDTRSTDSTRDIARERFNMWGSNYINMVFEDAFVAFEGLPALGVIDFAATRNKSLHLEENREDAAVFALSLSGDETLVEERPGALREFLEQHRTTDEDAFCVTMKRESASWPYARILRVDGGRRYRYPIHEVAVGKDGNTMGPLIPGVHIRYAPKDQSRLMKRMREVDLPVLTYLAEQPATTHEELSSRARALLFLAQTHENLALEHEATKEDASSPWLTHQMTAMSYYWRRSMMEGDPSDTNYSLFHFLEVVERINIFYTHEEFITRFGALAEVDPLRPEVRYKLALHASQLDPRLAAKYAMESVKVAREAKEKPLPFLTDSRIEWLSLHIAAECASKMKMIPRMKQLAAEGIAAGGPEAVFADFV
jgi:hypothetical protein